MSCPKILEDTVDEIIQLGNLIATKKHRDAHFFLVNVKSNDDYS